MGTGTQLWILLGLTLFNGVFTSAEIALLSVRRTRLKQLGAQGSSAAKVVLALRDKPERMLATVQVGITVISASAAVFGGATLEAPLAGFFRWLGLAQSAADGVAFVVVILFVSYLSLVLGELVPKSLALRAPEAFALALARPLAWLAWLSRPLVWLLTASSNLVLRPFKDRTSFSESRLSPEELVQLVDEAATAGTVPRGSAELAARSILLGTLTANALMVPRPKMVTLELSASREALLEVLRTRPHARYPVFDAEPERLIGYVVARELMLLADDSQEARRALLRPLAYFPATALAIDVLRGLQAEKQQLGVLVDEGGAVAGLLTIEDVAEEVLGEILEEHEVPPRLVWRDGASVLALGEAPLHEVARVLGQALPGEGAVTTFSGLVVQVAGRVPAVGEVVVLSPTLAAEVLEVSTVRVVKARVRVAG